MKRALVIGATGFIGVNVVDALLAEGVQVRVTTRPGSATLLLRKRKVERAPASLEEPEALRRAMDGCDTVFLTGAYYPRYSLDLADAIAQGVPGVKNACDAALAAGVRLCGPLAWRDRPDFTCFQAGSETAAITRGVAAELGPLANTQGRPEIGPLAVRPK